MSFGVHQDKEMIVFAAVRVTATALIVFAFLGLLNLTPAAPPTPEEIAKKVRELGADSFAVREAASKFLWETGKPAEAALREAVKGTDLEVTRRASEILAKFKWGIYPNTPKNIVDLINRYQGRDTAGKQEVVQELFKLGGPGYAAVLKVATAEEDAGLRQDLVDQATSTSSKTAVQLLLAGNPTGAEELLELCLTPNAEPTLRHFAAFLVFNGRLDAKIEQYRQRASQPNGTQAAEVLTYLYRAKGDLNRAREAAEKSGDKSLWYAVLYERGDWKTLAREVRTLKTPPDVDPVQALGYRAAYHRLAGEKEEFERLVGEIRKAATKADERAEEPTARWYAAKALLVNERVDDALALLSEFTNRLPAFEVLCAQLKYREALELADRAAPKVIQDEKGRLDIRRARVLHQLGEKDAAVQLFAKVAQELKQGDSPAFQALIEAETRLGLMDTALAQCAEVIPNLDSEHFLARSLFGQLFPGDPDTAVRLRLVLRKRFPDDSQLAALQRLKKLLTGQTPHAEVEALAEALIAATDTKDPSEAALRLQGAGELCHAGGLDDKAQGYFQKFAETADTYAARLRLADHLADRKRWQEAAQAYQSAWEKDQSQPLALFLRGWALEQAGPAEEGRKLMATAHAVPLGDVRVRHEFASALARRGLMDAARRERELIVRTGDFESWYLDDALRHLASDAAQNKQHLQAATYYERYLLRCLHVNRAFVDNSAYLIVAHMIHRQRASGLVAAGRVDEAQADIQRCLALLPAEVELPILLVGMLEKQGRKKEAGDLFGQVATTLEKLCTAYPNSAWAHNSLAWMGACCRRHLDQALTHAQKAVELSPGNAGLMDTLAEVHFQRGDKEKALTLMKQCLKLEPGSAYYRAQLKRFEAGDPAAELPPVGS
jgi:predicted Zn-dependent protease